MTGSFSFFRVLLKIVLTEVGGGGTWTAWVAQSVEGLILDLSSGLGLHTGLEAYFYE